MRRLTVTDVPALDLFYPCDDSTPQLLELLHACLDDFQPVAIHEHEGGNGWRVFFKTPDTRDGAARALTADFAGRLTSVSPADVPDDGWAARSQAKLGAVRIEQIVVAPPWETSAAKRGEILVVIEPSMGFGTGHHATTRLCLQLLQNVTVKGRRVIDVGTGSGVLAIAASTLGAATTVAVDCDPDALENARENIAKRRVRCGRGARSRSGRPRHRVCRHRRGQSDQRRASAICDEARWSASAWRDPDRQRIRP